MPVILLLEKARRGSSKTYPYFVAASVTGEAT